MIMEVLGHSDPGDHGHLTFVRLDSQHSAFDRAGHALRPDGDDEDEDDDDDDRTAGDLAAV